MIKNIYYSSCFGGEDAVLYPVKRQFMKPVQAKVRKPDNTEVLMGYGIGEIIEILSLNGQHCADCCGRLLGNGIPLADGSVILEWIGDLDLRYVPKFMNDTQTFLFRCIYENNGRETVANLHRKFMEKGLLVFGADIEDIIKEEGRGYISLSKDSTEVYMKGY